MTDCETYKCECGKTWPNYHEYNHEVNSIWLNEEEDLCDF